MVSARAEEGQNRRYLDVFPQEWILEIEVEMADTIALLVATVRAVVIDVVTLMSPSILVAATIFVQSMVVMFF